MNEPNAQSGFVEGRLPRWARVELARLRFENSELRKRLGEKAIVGPWLFVGDVPIAGVHDHVMAKVPIMGGDHDLDDLALIIRREGLDVHSTSGHKIYVQGEATNAFTIGVFP